MALDTTGLSSPILKDAELGAAMMLEAISSPVSLLGGGFLIALALIANTDLRGLAEGAAITITIDAPPQSWSATDEATPTSSDVDFEPDTVTASVAAYDLSTSMTDLLRQRDPLGMYNVPAIAGKMVDGALLTVVTAVADLADSLTKSVGGTGVSATWDLVIEAKNKIIASGLNQVGNLMVLVVHVNTWAQITTDLAAADGARANRREFDTTQGVRPVGFQGIWDDIVVYTTDAVPDDGTDYTGMLFAPGAIWYHIAPSIPASASEIRVLDVSGITVEERRTDKGVRLVGAMQFGTGVLRDELACKIITEIPA